MVPAQQYIHLSLRDESSELSGRKIVPHDRAALARVKLTEPGLLFFAGTAFLTLAGEARERLERQIERLATERPPVPQRVWRKPQWARPVWDVIHAKAIHRWQINHKLQLLEEILHEGQSWFDQREFYMLASARMDLEHLEPRNAADKMTTEKGA